MNYKTFLLTHIDGIFGQDEKALIEKMRANTKPGTAARRALDDCLTNDFNFPGCGGYLWNAVNDGMFNTQLIKALCAALPAPAPAPKHLTRHDIADMISDRMQAQIEKRDGHLAACGLTIEQCREIDGAAPSVFKDNGDVADLETLQTWNAYYNENADAIQAAQAQAMIAKFVELEKMDLMHCPCKYVVTDADRLTSPAGFHPDERIYLQTRIAMHTDSINPRRFKAPACNVRLYAHNLERGE